MDSTRCGHGLRATRLLLLLLLLLLLQSSL
jgi:hypothetical protein